jgi:biofilm PGA synthesis N-glycosyltransferase PgaC
MPLQKLTLETPQQLQPQLQDEARCDVVSAPPRVSRPTPFQHVPLRLACVIPCFNEALVLRETLTSVLAAGLSPADVLVVDDCSTDDTGLIAESFHVRVLRNRRNLGKSRSIARAIDALRQLGSHDFLSVLDADTLVDPNYFTTVVRTFDANADVVLVCGQPRSRRHNWLTAYRAVEYALSHGIYKPAQHRMRAITVAPGCASTYKMAVLEHLEWNPEILTEDADTTVQIYRKNLGRVAYERRAVVHTQDPATVRALRGQLRRWYTGLWQVVVCHRIPFGAQRLDAELALLAGEALVFSMLLVMAPLWLFAWPENAAYYFLIDQILCFAVACGVAVKQRRIDVVAYAPLFIVPRVMNSLVFLVTFIQIVVLRRNAVKWFSPPRYVSCSPAISPLHTGGCDA